MRGRIFGKEGEESGKFQELRDWQNRRMKRINTLKYNVNKSIRVYGAVISFETYQMFCFLQIGESVTNRQMFHQSFNRDTFRKI